MKKPLAILGELFIALLTVLWIMPLVWLVVTSLKSENTVMSSTLSFVFAPTLENYRKAFASTLLGRWMLNSLAVAVITTILTVLIDSTMAYVLARIPFRGRNALFLFILAGMMIPEQIGDIRRRHHRLHQCVERFFVAARRHFELGKIHNHRRHCELPGDARNGIFAHHGGGSPRFDSPDNNVSLI